MSVITSVRRRCQLAWLHLVATVLAAGEWADQRRQVAAADERGLTTAEYVALGAVVVVAAGGVGAIIAAFLNAKAGQIVGTP